FDEAKNRVQEMAMSALQGTADLGKRVLIRGATTLAREIVPQLFAGMRSGSGQRPAVDAPQGPLVTVLRPLARRLFREGIGLLVEQVRTLTGMSSSMTLAGLCAATGPAQPICDCILSSLSSFALDGLVNLLADRFVDWLVASPTLARLISEAAREILPALGVDAIFNRLLAAIRGGRQAVQRALGSFFASHPYLRTAMSGLEQVMDTGTEAVFTELERRAQQCRTPLQAHDYGAVLECAIAAVR